MNLQEISIKIITLRASWNIKNSGGTLEVFANGAIHPRHVLATVKKFATWGFVQYFYNMN